MAASTDQTDRAGIHAVGLLFTKLNWAFREQPTSDFGIDAQAEKLNSNGKAGGKLIALQIKSGASHFRKRGDGYVFYGEERHLEYWTNHSLPVFLILHNPETSLTIWQRIERHLIEEQEGGRWSIGIPADQTLDQAHEKFIATGITSDLASLRRSRLALDLPLIKEFAEHGAGYMRIEDWVNKTLNYRGADIVFGEEPDGEIGLSINALMPGYTIEYYMAVFFPWLKWAPHEYIGEDDGSYEVAEHILSIELSDVGRTALLLEEFYKSDLPPFRPDPDEISLPIDWHDREEGEL